jgi:hypothetical protein
VHAKNSWGLRTCSLNYAVALLAHLCKMQQALHYDARSHAEAYQRDGAVPMHALS